ncbi:HAMP domain-containing sensor histidine kinase [Dactylosporangium sp. AC04546]|uniref:sensor histidine kinase n=1 Tax=Dactylosporangium sp. AC04546 TaxID=2862460 RepID=UPI002E7C0DA9|nr:HAMP domain-containing sensor histidine kinase [Dactylosporangium sp. AC04546]WVK78669.1 HAMP domain-containing sensor histidine kinase [Dactylosporangium sp. AC04546]
MGRAVGRVVGRWPMRRSLLVGMLAVTAAVLLVAGTTAAVALRGYLLARTDDQLDIAARFAQQRVGQLDGPAGRGTLQAVIAPSDYLVEVRRPDGSLTRLGSLQSMPGRPLLDQAPAPPSGGRLSPAVNLDDGRYRAVVATDATGATVLVALPTEPVRQTVRRLVLTELSAGLAMLLLLAAAGRLLVARSLRPLEQITATAAAIADGRLDRRVPAGPPAHTEVGRLTVAVNGMLGRIEAALSARAASQERLRRFVADASHELRTPLTSIRGYLQLLRQGIVGDAEQPAVLGRAEDEARRMGALVDDLLYLARLDAEPALRHEPFDLVPAVRDSVSDLLAAGPGRPVHAELPGACPVRGDEDAVRQVVANLLANVRVHTPPGTPVTVTVAVRSRDGHAEVADRGPGMPPDLAARAFDRFTRGDGARGTGGSGLGLSIAAEIVAAHGGTITLDTAPGHGTTVRFTLPTATPDTAAGRGTTARCTRPTATLPTATPDTAASHGTTAATTLDAAAGRGTAGQLTDPTANS